MARENIGDIKCPFCGGGAHVRRYNRRKPPTDAEGAQRHGKMYVHCAECGPILAASQKVQVYILENGKLYGAEAPQDSSKPTPAPVRKPAEASPPARPVKPAASSSRKPLSFDYDPYA